MSLWRSLSRGVRALTHRDTVDSDITDEVSHYLDLATAANIGRGMTPDDARRAARIELGNPTVTREHVRTYGWESGVDAVLADLRYAVRRLHGNPGFTVVSVLTLALGIGATTAIFSAINPILIEPLPYPSADRLLTIADRQENGSPRPPTLGTFAEVRARARSFESLAAVDGWKPSITDGAEPERLVGQRVTANYFHTLGIAPAAGRSFVDAEDEVGGPRVVILSARLAQRRFGGTQSIVGGTVMLDGNQYRVIGVMPRQFANVLAPSADVWSTLQARATADFNTREWGHHYQIVGRLAPNVTTDAGARELASIARTRVSEFPRPPWSDLGVGLSVRSLKDDVTGDVKPAFYAIIGAVVVLLAIACVNVTNLLVARGAQRRGEFAVRLALGAGRQRLLRQLLTETLVLSLVGGLLGLAVAEAGVRALVALSPPGLPRIEAISLNPTVFAFALAITTLVGLVVGFVPAIGASRADLRDGLQQSSRRTIGGPAAARSTLVIAEVALALVLLVNAGLLIRSLERLFGVAPGFQSSHLLTMQVIEPGRQYSSDTVRQRAYDRALEVVRHLPGVRAAAVTSQLPLSGDLDGYGYEVQSKPTGKAGENGSAFRYVVSPDYFGTMGIPLRRGRLLDARDATEGAENVVVSESFAKREFGDRNPIGERVRFGPEAGSTRPWDIIVGVVADVKQESLAGGETGAFYVTAGRWWWADNNQSMVVRTSGDPITQVPNIKRAVWSVDAHLPIERIASMDGLIAVSASDRHFVLVVIETFAGAALLLAAIGMYGVISGGVTERVREIGIRSALGANSRDIVGQVIGRGVSLAAVGVVIGVGGAMASSRLLESLLFGVSRLDIITYAGVSALLVGVALLASWLPARRAARIDPTITLRAE
jgi:putative ABC transport system permease protein